jgi:hypothetical protein
MSKRIIYICIGIFALIIISSAGISRQTSKHSSTDDLHKSQATLRSLQQTYSTLPSMELITTKPITSHCEELSEALSLHREYTCTVQTTLYFVSDKTLDFSALAQSLDTMLTQGNFESEYSNKLILDAPAELLATGAWHGQYSRQYSSETWDGVNHPHIEFTAFAPDGVGNYNPAWKAHPSEEQFGDLSGQPIDDKYVLILRIFEDYARCSSFATACGENLAE